MQAIVCPTPNQLELREVPRPKPQPGEALVRIRRVGVCGTDLHAFRGRQPFFSYPRILGHECAGEIVEMAGTDPVLRVGDRVSILPYLACGECAACRRGKTNCCVKLQVLGVHADGGMQEYVTVPFGYLVQANAISLEAAAIVECLSIGCHAVGRAELNPGEYALVIGAGPIGLGIMKFLQLAGVRVIAMDTNPDRLAFCKSWAAVEYTVRADHAEQEPLEQLRSLTNGDLAQVVFDATGNAKSMEQAFAYAAHGGQVVYVSLVRENITFFDPDFHQKEMTLKGSRNATLKDFQAVIAAMTSGHIDTERFITHKADAEAAVREFESWTQRETGVIKAMIEF